VPRAVVLDEDDQDGELNPTGDSTTKKKGKSKAKEEVAKPTERRGKSKESAAAGFPPKAQVEVVFTTIKGKGREPRHRRKTERCHRRRQRGFQEPRVD
jgi:hypothetical protein